MSLNRYPEEREALIAETIEYLAENGVALKRPFPVTMFINAPASTKYHGAYEGGLFDHSEAVMDALLDLTDNMTLTWERPESPYIVGLFHDLCKIDMYEWDIETGKFKYSNDPIIDGHGEKSIIYLQKYIDLTDEEIACIRWHMGAYETDTKKWEYFDRAIRKYPNVLYTHTADMIASKIVGV